MGTHFFKGDFDAPTGNDPSQNLQWAGLLVGSKESRRGQFAERVAHQYPAHGQGGMTGGIPQGGASGYWKAPFVSTIPSDLTALPNGGRVAQPAFQRGLTWPFLG